MLNHKWDNYITLPSSRLRGCQGGEKRKNFKNERSGRTWPMSSGQDRTAGSLNTQQLRLPAADLHKVSQWTWNWKPTATWKGERLIHPTPRWGTIDIRCLLGKERDFFKTVAPMLGQSCSSGRPHTHEYIGRTNWTDGLDVFLKKEDTTYK